MLHRIGKLLAAWRCLLLAKLISAGRLSVTRVIDGDTIVVQGVGPVCLVGVDTPETRGNSHPSTRTSQSPLLGDVTIRKVTIP